MKKGKPRKTPYLKSFVVLSLISILMLIVAFFKYKYGTNERIIEGDFGTQIIPAMPPGNHEAITLFIYSFIIGTIGTVLLIIGINKNRTSQ